MNNKFSVRNYDLTQKGSKRGGEHVTRIALEQESDEANENTNPGQVSSEKGDNAAENKVATSLDNE